MQGRISGKVGKWRGGEVGKWGACGPGGEGAEWSEGWRAG